MEGEEGDFHLNSKLTLQSIDIVLVKVDTVKGVYSVENVYTECTSGRNKKRLITKK